MSNENVRYKLTKQEFESVLVPAIRNLIKVEGYSRIPKKGESEDNTVLGWVRNWLVEKGASAAAEKLTKANITKMFKHPDLKGIRPKGSGGFGSGRSAVYGAFDFDDDMEFGSANGADASQAASPTPEAPSEDTSDIF